MKKICLISLGCAKNTVDSEAILGLLKSGDFLLTEDPQESDCILINTCGFILPAKVEGINTILEMSKYKKKLVVMGCLVERYYDELKSSIPEVDLWIPFKEEYSSIATKLANLLDEKIDKNFNIFNRVISTNKSTVYLKISEGCDNFCAFCAIPFIRGRFVSYPLKSLVEYSKKLAKDGYKELVVIGQDPTSYGKDLKDKNINLLSLLKELDEIEGFESIRLLYLYPDGINDDLLDFIASSKRISHYLDIPIQHISNKILKSMNRRDTKESTVELFKKIRQKIPDCILRTTLIVGFPGETKKDFDELLNFVKSIKFNHLGVFTYSKEEGTKAYYLKYQVSKAEKERRRELIMEAQSHISYELNKALVGKIFKGQIIGIDNEDYLLRCYYNSPDDIDGSIIMKNTKPHNIGDSVSIKITSAFVYDLMGEEVI